MPHEDQKYINALLNNHSSLVNELYKKFAPQCKSFIKKNSGNAEDAMDIFQESLIYVTRKARTTGIQLTVPFGGYLYFVYRSKWLDELKKRKIFNLRIEDINLYIDDKVTYLIELKFIIYKACFDKLDEACKEIFGSRFLKLDSKEIAEELEIEPNAVDQRMYYCREKLKKCIEQHPDFENLKNM